ncbi:TetR/AcrR family transcriptional regulator C-terminal domain-containing protein [Nonomuraea longicatena]|uniref:TetR/AcrR family transcriptional regulator n=1 Tax=Nonomuraea longicatena TaxID=83682 RepID=A0ABP4BTS5_9ACTN
MTSKPFTSVWTREPRQSKAQPGLSREQIVRTALELLDAEGAHGLSMRKLGAKLGAGATSVYWHVVNKDELMELAFDEVWGEMTLPDPATTGWRDMAAAFAHDMRAVILRHPWTAGLIGRMPALGPRAISVTMRLRDALERDGFSGHDVDNASSTLTSFVFGFTIPEVAWQSLMEEKRYDQESMRAVVASAVAAYPGLRERIEAQKTDSAEERREEAFAYGLAAVLDGLEARPRA